MASWLMRWVWEKPSRRSLCSLTSPVRKVTDSSQPSFVSYFCAITELFPLLLCAIADVIIVLSAAGNWGPHLIIVPTSVMLNWEMELKRWCPGFKILTYFGSQKERKLKRQVINLHILITTQTNVDKKKSH